MPFWWLLAEIGLFSLLMGRGKIANKNQVGKMTGMEC